MILASAHVMVLTALRDRMALLFVLVLPPLVFLVFAAIFSGTSGERLRLGVGVVDEVHSRTTGRLVDALSAEPTLRVRTMGDAAEARAAVRSGTVDVALVIRTGLDAGGAGGSPPILVIDDPSRALAASVVVGQVTKTLSERLPDVTLSRVLADVEASGAIAAEDRAVLDDAFKAQAVAHAGGKGGFSFAALFDRGDSDGRTAGPGVAISYYAGAIAAVFVLFGALHGAMSLLDERQNGIARRMRLGSGIEVVVVGKFLFLLAQGAAQITLVFGVAMVVFDASVGLASFGPWLVTVLVTASAAAAMALAVAAACSTRRQAEALATFGTLLLSAVGGSMVPRYLMPPWLQDIGWVSPNAWIIEAYQRQPVMLPHRPFTVRQLLQPGRTSGNLIYFVRQSTLVNSAAMVSEGAQKPESNITFAPDTAAVKTIAHWIPVSRQAFDDVLGMESMIDGELRYGLDYVEEQEWLFGDGTGEHLKGLATQATPFAAPAGLTTDATAGSAADKIDTLLQGIVQAELALLPATGMILNTVDWAQIISAKDKNGQYLGNGPFGTLQGRSIWDLPTAVTPAMPRGQFMVGSLGTSAQIFDRLDAEVVVSSEDRDNFIKNTLTVRAEKRLALAVKRPAGIIYGAFRAAA